MLMGFDSCTCRTGYTGRNCESCAEGYQDNNRDGTCSPSCKMLQVTCTAPKVCSDMTGTANCSCPPYTTGTMCEACRDVCPTRAIRAIPRLRQAPIVAVREVDCTGCGDCVAACPVSAITLVGAAHA